MARSLRKCPPDLQILVLEAISYGVNTAPALAALLGGPVQRMSSQLYSLLKQGKIKTVGHERRNVQGGHTVNRYKRLDHVKIAA